MSNFISMDKATLKQFSELLFNDTDEHKKSFSGGNTPKIVVKYLYSQLMKKHYDINFSRDLVWKKKGEIIDFNESNFYKQHKSILSENGELDLVILKQVQKDFYQMIKGSSKTIELQEDLLEDESKKDNLSLIRKDDLCNYYSINEHTSIKQIYDALYESCGNCRFKFNFDKKTIDTSLPDVNYKKLQRFKITIKTPINTFTKTVKLHYRCDQCGYEFNKSLNDIASTKGSTKCPNIIDSVSGGVKQCNNRLSAPTEESDSISFFSYDSHYLDGTKPINITTISTDELENYEYDCVGLVLQESNQQYIWVLDYKKIEKKNIDFSNIITEKSAFRKPSSVDIIPEIIEYFDETIKNILNETIVGMYDIKLAFIIQKLMHLFAPKKQFNIAIVGKNDSGKTYISDRYGMLLYGGGGYVKTSGNSVSIPALRGSAVNSNNALKGRKTGIGMLSVYPLICIDEVKENADIMPNLKPFLLENEMGNFKADGDKINYYKLAHVNITQNPKNNHLLMYKNMIKKLYNEYLEDPSKRALYEEDLSEDDEIFDERWDLQQPLHTYANPLLRRCIATVRFNFENEDIHWLDGEETAVHDRFYFYYYIKRNQNTESNKLKLLNSMDDVTGFKQKEEEYLMDAKIKLSIGNIDEFFQLHKKFFYCDIPDEHVQEAKNKIADIMAEREFEQKSRLGKACMAVANASRTLNRRNVFTEIDYNYVRRYLMTQDRAIYPEQMFDLHYIEPISSQINNNNSEKTMEEEIDTFSSTIDESEFDI